MRTLCFLEHSYIQRLDGFSFSSTQIFMCICSFLLHFVTGLVNGDVVKIALQYIQLKIAQNRLILTY